MSLTLQLIDEAAAEAIVAGSCPPGFRCAPDYPAEGDRVAAGLFLERCAAAADPRPFGAFLICRHDAHPRAGEDALVVGGIGFHGGVDECGRVEIGYGVVPSHRGAGYATQALGRLIGRASELGARILTAETDRENAASQAVLTHHGFTNYGGDERAIYFELVLC